MLVVNLSSAFVEPSAFQFLDHLKITLEVTSQTPQVSLKPMVFMMSQYDSVLGHLQRTGNYLKDFKGGQYWEVSVQSKLKLRGPIAWFQDRNPDPKPIEVNGSTSIHELGFGLGP